MRRRVLAIILSISMAVTLLAGLPAGAEAAADSSIVQVKLSIGSVTSFSFYADGNYSVGGKALVRALYTVKIESGTLNMYLGSRLISSGATIGITQHAATAGRNNFIWLRNDHYNAYLRYLGDMRFSISSGKLLLVNCLDLEQYLCGVVPHEMNDSWPAEALKSQAVAARNYTVRRMSGSGSYDLTDDSGNDQVYKGYDPDNVHAIAAVNATAGQVLMSGTAVIDAYYSASNGGWTELPYHRWGGGSDWTYYKIMPDPYDTANSSSRYEKIVFPVVIDATHPVTTATNASGTINADNAAAYIRQAIFQSGKLSGVTGPDDFTLTGVIKLVTHTYDTASGQDHSKMPWNGVNDCVDKVCATGDFTVSVSGTSVSVTGVELELRQIGPSGAFPAFFDASLGIYLVEPVYTGDTITAYALSMRRYGHALGLSQRGAQQRARSVAEGGAGQTYAQILGFYYPGAALTTRDFTRPTPSTITPAPDYSTATVAGTSSLNVRSSPSSSSDANVIGALPEGARIEVTDDFYASSWHQIEYGGVAAYVHKDYVVLDSPQVPKHVSGVALDIVSATISTKDTLTLKATVSPSTAADPSVTWSSDNTAAATVSGGVVTAVAEGTAHITVKTNEGGYTAVCTVTVKSNGITSTKYRIDGTTISGVRGNTTVAQFFTGLGNSAANLHVYKADGTEVTGGAVGTGMTVALVGDGGEIDRLSIVVLGDPTGDGIVDILDYTSVRLAILELRPLSGVYALAADANRDGTIDILDYTAIRFDILGLKSIS